MAGNKETPRQRMIGMMYLVLTALLALNVSKEIVNAFVKLNDKLEISNNLLEKQTAEIYDKFEFAMSIKNTKKATEPWNERALKIKMKAESEIEFLLNETNVLLQEVEGKLTNWIFVNKKTGKKELKSLMDVEGKEDYDAATRLFVGGNPLEPIERGKKIKMRLNTLRNFICETMSAYTYGKKKFVFDINSVRNFDPKKKESNNQLAKAMERCNPADTAKIAQIFRTLSYPEKLTEYGEETSWEGSMFDHSPVVAAAALFTSLRMDIKTCEAIAIEHLYNKIYAPVFPINKIEPVAFAPTGYLNIGDTMPLKVMIAAYDSNNVSQIRYSTDENLENYNETKGVITLKADVAGEKKIFGKIAVKERGELVWKPWQFRYEVGAPMATISHLDLNVLYTNYENNIAISASGYSAEQLTLNGSGAEIKRNGKNYLVKVSPTMAGRTVTLVVNAKGKKLGEMIYRVKNTPRPSTYLGDIDASESKISKSKLNLAVSSGLRLGYDASSVISLPFKVTGFEIKIDAGNGAARTFQGQNGKFPQPAIDMIKTLRPGAVISCRDIRGLGKTNNIVRGVPISLVVE